MINEENVKEYISEIKNWIQEIMTKANSNGVVLGMSGGIDCSVVGRLFQEAGCDVILVLMPYKDSMDYSNDYKDAIEYINKFNFKCTEIPLDNVYNELLTKIANPKTNIFFKEENKLKCELIDISDMAKSNILPRLRMTTLYTLAQSKGYLVAGTGNLSERTMGYFTKWGDGACDINPIGNLTKTEVRILAKELDIPKHIIDKAPSANLWKGQTDEDEMGVTYEIIDKFINGEDIPEAHKHIIENQIIKTNHKRRDTPIFCMENN